MSKKIKVLIFFLIFINIVYLKARVIAKVGPYTIEQQEFIDTVEKYAIDDSLNWEQLKNKALREVINNYLFIIYSDKNGITVSQSELDKYFIKHLGNDPSLQTNGVFDYDKYVKLKRSPKGQKILEVMRKDILVNKAKELIKSNFNITEDDIYNEFLSENMDVDISYAILDFNGIDNPGDYNPEEVRKYYFNNKDSFLTSPKKLFEFFVVKEEPFLETAEKYAEVIFMTKAKQDSSYTDSLLGYFPLKDSTFKDTTISVRTKNKLNLMKLRLKNLRESILQEKIQSLINNKINLIKNKLKNNDSLDIVLFETGYITKRDTFGFLNKTIMDSIFTLKNNEFSETMQTEFGKVVFRLKDIQKQQPASLQACKREVLQSFLDAKQTDIYAIKKYYEENFDKFIKPAVYLKKIIIPEQRLNNLSSLITELNNNYANESLISRLVRRYNLEYTKDILFLEDYEYKNPVDEVIAQKINKENEQIALVDTEAGKIIYIVETYFPEFIPEFHQVEDKIKKIIKTTSAKIDTVLVKEFYEEHKSIFKTKDSLSLGGMFFEIEPDSVNVAAAALKEYYQNFKKSFYKPESMQFIIFSNNNRKVLENIKSYFDKNVKIELLVNIFGSKNSEKQVAVDDLQNRLKQMLEQTPMQNFSEIFRYQNRWHILYKKNYFFAGLRRFTKVKPEIEKILKNEKARKIAYQKAKTVYDSTEYFANCYKYSDYGEIFKTKMKPIDADFEYIGNVEPYKSELLRIWPNMKLTSIIENREGYNVVFLLKKKYSQQQEFAEARPEIVKILAQQSNFERAKEFTKSVRDSIKNGADADSLLYFWGGWKHAENLCIDSEIPGLKISKLILSDIVDKKEDYWSPVLKSEDNVLVFYHIDRKKYFSSSQYLENKTEIKQNLIERKFRNWIDEYEQKINIKIYN